MEIQKNVFIKSAELGVPFGLLLLVASAAMLYADKLSLLSIVTLTIALLAPLVIYRWQRQRYVRSAGFSTFSELWTLGIFTTMGGALICALVTYGLITCLRPDFVYEQAQYVVEAYKHMPGAEAKEFATTIEKAIKSNILPTPIDFCMQMFWLTASLGCVGGAITALIAGKIPIKPQDNSE